MQHSCHSASQLSDQMFERQSHWNISVSWVCHYDVLHIFRVPPNYTAFSLRCSLSGSPCRLSPGSAGQLSASLYILHPGYLCVCGSALHPEQRTEVHHLWHLSVRCVWVSFFLSYLWFVTLTIPPLFFFIYILTHFHFCCHWCPCFLQSRPVYHDRSLHLHRPLPHRWELRPVWSLLYPGVDLFCHHIHLLHHLLCATQEDCMRRTLKLAPTSPKSLAGSTLSAKIWF